MRAVPPAALAFRKELGELLTRHFAAAGDDDMAYAGIVGMLYAEACKGCHASGVPLEFAIQVLAELYEVTIVTQKRGVAGSA